MSRSIQRKGSTYSAGAFPQPFGSSETDTRFSTVNIWDFGGQEIYHATHQFFLTGRSLYVLVADDRKEDTDFNYWLQVVELLSDRSPLLIVQNEKQDRQRDIDLRKLRADFPSLREAFRTNLATNRGLSELERAIRQELEYLPQHRDSTTEDLEPGAGCLGE